jgi:predicted nucleic acid-binding protein
MKAAAINRFVLDASTVLAWCFPEDGSPYAQAVLDLLAGGAEAIVPEIWALEVANALLVGERRKRRTQAQVMSLLQHLSSLRIAVQKSGTDWVFSRVLSVARQERLSVYDAAYLDTALREGLPLATLDDDLRRAARDLGVSVSVA